MSEPSPAYLWYPKDVMSSGRVAALSPLEELWYRRALDQSWLHVGMPKNAAEFAGWVGRGCTVESARKIMRTFFEFRMKGSENIFNEKQERLRKELRRKSKERSKAGIESGRKRRERSRLEAEQMFNKTETKPNISTSSSFPFSSSFSSEDLKRLIEEVTAKNPKKDPRVVEIAVLQTLMNRNGSPEPINSAHYFSDEIKHLSAKSTGLRGETVDVVLQARRQQILQKCVGVAV